MQLVLRCPLKYESGVEAIRLLSRKVGEPLTSNLLEPEGDWALAVIRSGTLGAIPTAIAPYTREPSDEE